MQQQESPRVQPGPEIPKTIQGDLVEIPVQRYQAKPFFQAPERAWEKARVNSGLFPVRQGFQNRFRICIPVGLLKGTARPGKFVKALKAVKKIEDPLR